MKPGDYVLNLIKDAPKNRRTIALIRHSKRESFNGIPDELRDSVGITEEGIVMAREFGEAMNQIPSVKRLLLGHTIAKRAEMTAQSIFDGYCSESQARILGCEPTITSPVVNLDNLVKVRNTFGWSNLIIKWLDEKIPGNTLRNPYEYTDETLRNVLHYPGLGRGELLIIVAHDITLFPLIYSLFGENVKSIEFLNGIVISADTNIAEISFVDAKNTFKTERRIS
ncbi:MAG: hypothetical protein PHP59_03565 [Methanofollis sp.]|uniref:hypothetical protein n=1 Tax=Methanofollis sp. TaxID=2052835 RepID=UPI002629EFC4|nr:hypothetical protein [Methanofollis sp.]MDD4254433.1 hypothetical protein [Methanofollis sp.]